MGTMPTTLEELLDREQIRACLFRYTRGVDRHDAELLRSAYHEGAIDDHGEFLGDRDQFIDWVLPFHERHARHQHFLTNITIDLDGDVAHVETYYFTVLLDHDENIPLNLNGGRYVDRFEKRSGIWAIVERVSMNEWQHEATPTQLVDQVRRGIKQSPSDVSYERPLQVRRPPGQSPPQR